jgi:hypothetical protein
MEWYWYLTGVSTVIFLQSVLLNIGLAKGWVEYHGRKNSKPRVHIYDQDNIYTKGK